MIRVSGIQHHVACPGVLIPSLARRQVHGAKLPLAQRVRDSCLEPPFLLFIAYFEPELEQRDSTFRDVLFKEWAKLKEAPVLCFGTKAHYVFHSGTVVPAPIKDHNFSGRG